MSAMTDREWRDFRDRPDRPLHQRAWTILEQPDYEKMLAHFYRPVSTPKNYPRESTPELVRQRSRVDAVWLLRSQTDGRLHELLAGYHVAELEALVRILERPRQPEER